VPPCASLFQIQVIFNIQRTYLLLFSLDLETKSISFYSIFKSNLGLTKSMTDLISQNTSRWSKYMAFSRCWQGLSHALRLVSGGVPPLEVLRWFLWDMSYVIAYCFVMYL
jgi:hypothetical protein